MIRTLEPNNLRARSSTSHSTTGHCLRNVSEPAYSRRKSAIPRNLDSCPSSFITSHSSASERVVWLCEELGVSYTLKTYDRDPLPAPPEYKALHPQGSAPVIQDTSPDGHTITLAETAAVFGYISSRHARQQRSLPPAEPSGLPRVRLLVACRGGRGGEAARAQSRR